MTQQFVETLAPLVAQTGAMIVVLGLLLLAVKLLARGLGAASRRRRLDGNDPLRHPMVGLARMPVMSGAERAVYHELRGLAADWRLRQRGITVHAKAALAAAIAVEGSGAPWRRAARSIAGKRFDFLLVDGRGLALVAVAYRGAGTPSRASAKHDRETRTACELAGLALVEIDGRETPSHYLGRVMEALGDTVVAPPHPPVPAPQPAPPPSEGRPSLVASNGRRLDPPSDPADR